MTDWKTVDAGVLAAVAATVVVEVGAAVLLGGWVVVGTEGGVDVGVLVAVGETDDAVGLAGAGGVEVVLARLVVVGEGLAVG